MKMWRRDEKNWELGIVKEILNNFLGDKVNKVMSECTER